MKIPFDCPCGYDGEEDEALRGKLTPCPRCGQLQVVGGAQRKGVRRERPPEPAFERRSAYEDPDPDENPYAPPSSDRHQRPVQEEWVRPQYDDSAIPVRDPEHEAHIRAIAVWQFISAGLLVVGAFLVAGLMATGIGLSPPLLVALGLALAALCYGLGRALWDLKGWSRWVYGALTGLGLVSNVIGAIHDPSTLLSGGVSSGWSLAILWALFCNRADPLFRPEYQEALRMRAAHVEWARSPFFWGPFAFCCLAGVAGFFFGFAASAGI